MAKLSDRQRNNILAKWNTGNYSKTDLAKAYKVHEKTIREIVGKEPPRNAYIVEAQTALEISKKAEKTPIEVSAINQAVKMNLDSLEYKQKNIRSVHEVASDILNGLQRTVKNAKAQKVVTIGMGGGASSSEVVDYDMQPEHYEKAANTVYKVAQVYGAIEDKPSVAIQNNNIIEVEIE